MIMETFAFEFIALAIPFVLITLWELWRRRRNKNHERTQKILKQPWPENWKTVAPNFHIDTVHQGDYECWWCGQKMRCERSATTLVFRLGCTDCTAWTTVFPGPEEPLREGLPEMKDKYREKGPPKFYQTPEFHEFAEELDKIHKQYEDKE